MTAQGPEHRELPKGWKSHVELGTGKVFYVHEGMQVTTYMRPSPWRKWRAISGDGGLSFNPGLARLARFGA